MVLNCLYVTFIVTQVHMLGVKSCGMVSHMSSGAFLKSHCSSLELVILHHVFFLYFVDSASCNDSW